jgi:hypothetical protein
MGNRRKESEIIMVIAIIIAVLAIAGLWYVCPVAVMVIAIAIGVAAVLVWVGAPVAAIGAAGGSATLAGLIIWILISSIASFNEGLPNLMAGTPQEIANPDRGHRVQEPPPAPVAKAKRAVATRASAPPAKKCAAKGGCDAAGKPLPKFLADYKKHNGLK